MTISPPHFCHHDLRPSTAGFVSFKEIDHEVVALDFPAPRTISVPELRKYELFSEAQAYRSGTFETPRPQLVRLRNVLYCPMHELLLTSQRKIIRESFNVQCDMRIFGEELLHSAEIEHLRGSFAVFRGGNRCYYHSLLEEMPRAWLLACSTPKEGPVDLIYGGILTAPERMLLQQICRQEARLGFTGLERSKLYQLEQVIMPSYLTHRFAGYVPEEYHEAVIAPLRKHYCDGKEYRILIERRDGGTKKRLITNQQALNDMLTPLGFESLILEDLSFEEQIRYFAGATCVVGAHGSGLGNMIFGNGAQMIELFPSPVMLPHYAILAHTRGLRYEALFAASHSRDSCFAADMAAVCALIGRHQSRRCA